MAIRADVLPRSLAPRGLSRVEAAAYVGVSPSTFDKLIEAGLMPRPKIFPMINRRVWDRELLDLASKMATRLLDNDPELNSADNLMLKNHLQLQHGKTQWSKIS